MTLRRHAPRVAGFTLLEMGLVLFILFLIAGVAMPAISSLLGEERLREHAREFLKFARTARRLAVSENRPYEIRFAPKNFALEPYSAGDHKPEVLRNHVMAPGTSYLMQRWGGKGFEKPEDETWVFQPTGICEPIKIQFQRGRDWIEFTINPLTARAQEETYHFP